MSNNMPRQAAPYVKNQTRKRRWHRIVMVLSCIVVFCTTYALIIPAITMSQKPICGIEENHVHTDACYEERSVPGGLQCPVPIHVHTGACYNSSGEVICGYADYTIHTHTAECCDENGALVCQITKTAAEHVHSAACTETVSSEVCENEGHTHTETCYSDRVTLICGLEESEGHTHGDACYDENGALICGMEESEGHLHEETCYAVERTLVCGLEESTGKTAETYERLICTRPEITEHRHTADCFRFYEGFNAEGFDPADYSTVDWSHCELICGKTQVLKHQHTADCFAEPTVERVLVCDIPEGHQHDPILCYPAEKEYTLEPEYTCGMGEHQHSAGAGCYNEDGELICTQPEHVHDPVLCRQGRTEEEPAVALMPAPKALLAAGSPGGGSGGYDLFDYLTGVSGTGTVQNPDGSYTTTLNLTFRMERSHLNAAVMNGVPFVCDLPEGILLTDSLVNGGPYTAYKRGTTDEVAFTYEFVDKGNGTYGIEITFDPAYVQTIPTSDTMVDNDLSFRANIDGDKYDEEDGIIIVFRDNIELDIPPQNINKNADITVTKYGSLQPGDKLRYGVRVSSVKGTPGEITLSDLLTYTGGGTLTPPVLISVTTQNGTDITQSPYVTFTTDADDPNAFTMTLPQLGEGEYYIINYEYGIEGLSGNVEVGANNTVTAGSTDGTETVGDIAVSRIWPTPRTVISKSGEAVTDGIRWTVTLNEAGADIAGQTFTDPMLAQLSAGDIDIYNASAWAAAGSSEYTVLYSGSGEITGILFNAVDGASNTNSYTVTYVTPVDNSNVEFGGASSVSNTGAFDGGSATGTVGVTGGSVGKTVEDASAPAAGSPGSVTWGISVNIPPGGIAPGSPVVDSLSGTGHYMTPAQAQALRTALQNTWGGNLVDLTFTGADDQTVDIDTAPANTQITGYAFTIGNEGGTENLYVGGAAKSWTYTTTADTGSGETGTFRNTVRVRDIETSAEKSFNPNVKKYNRKTEANGWQVSWSEGVARKAITDPDETFVWMVKVTTAGDAATYTVTDTLPEGVELAELYLYTSQPTVSYYTNSNNALSIDESGALSGPPVGFFGYTIGGSVNGGTVTLQITPPAGGIANELYLVYVCRLSEDVWPASGHTETFVLNNGVSVTHGDDDYGGADNTQIIDATSEAQALSKSGVWNQGSQTVTYTLDINPDAEDLLPGADTLTLKDILTYSKTISRDGVTVNGTTTATLASVRLEKEVNGVWVAEPVNWSAAAADGVVNWDPTYTYLITPETSTLTMEIPDETHLRLTYVYAVSSNFTDFNVVMDNEALLEGTAAAGGEDHTEIEHEDFETHGSSTFEGKAFYLEKVAEDDHSVPVKGAVFRVYKYEPWYPGPGWFETDMTYTTDDDGIIMIQQTDKLHETDETAFYDFDTAYYIVEEEAPAGFLLPESPPKQFFWFGSSGVLQLSNPPNDFPANAPNVSVAIANVVVTNAQIPKEEYELPETGGCGTHLYMLGGAVILLTTLHYVIALRRKRGRRANE